MPRDRTRLRVWCEDRNQEQFLRALFTTNYGVSARDLDFKVAPSGQGAASYWVAQQYQIAQREARASKHQRQLGFLVVLDGDNHGGASRKQAMLGGQQDTRDPDCNLAIWAPTWSIETWVGLLSGRLQASPTIEDRSFKIDIESQWTQLLPSAIAAWNPAHPLACPSLKDAFAELQRLPV
jgi:hypothetical protein